MGGTRWTRVAVAVVAAGCFGISPRLAAASVGNDQVQSQHIREADGTSGQNTNSGAGVKTGHLQNAAVTAVKLADGAVTAAKIANGAVTSAKISGAIGADKLGAYAGQRIVHLGPADGVNTFQSVAAAIASITDAGPQKRYLVKVMPGRYVQTVPLQMGSWIDLEGSGQENTVIASTIPADDHGEPPVHATLLMAANTRIGNLRVENTSEELGGTAVGVNDVGPAWIENVTLEAAGAGHLTDGADYTALMIKGTSAAGVVVKGVTATARTLTAGNQNAARAAILGDGASVTILNSSLLGHSGLGWARGMYVIGYPAVTADIRDSVFEGINPSPDGTAGGIFAWWSDHSLTIVNTRMIARNAGWCDGLNGAVSVLNSEVRMVDCVAGNALAGVVKAAGTVVQGPLECGSVGKLAGCWDENFDPLSLATLCP